MLPTVKDKVLGKREYLERTLYEYHAYDESLDIWNLANVKPCEIGKLTNYRDSSIDDKCFCPCPCGGL
jgi:hypothetical protein